MFTRRERRGAMPAVEREVRGACGGSGGPAWNEMPRDLRPACSAPAPHRPSDERDSSSRGRRARATDWDSRTYQLRGVALRNASVRAMREVDMQWRAIVPMTGNWRGEATPHAESLRETNERGTEDPWCPIGAILNECVYGIRKVGRYYLFIYSYYLDGSCLLKSDGRPH